MRETLMREASIDCLLYGPSLGIEPKMEVLCTLTGI